MKVTNIVLCILIFLLAVASAAFSYMLFGKRTTLLELNDKSAAAIVAASALTAPTSDGQPVAKESLTHEKYDAAKVDSALRRFNSQVETAVQQRNALAEGFKNISDSIGLKDPATKKEFTVDRIGKLEEVPGKNNKQVQIPVKIQEEVKELHGNFVSASKVLDFLVSSLKRLKIRGAGNISLTSGNYAANMNQIREAVKVCRDELEQSRQDLAKAKRENSELKKSNGELVRENKSLAMKLDSARREKDRLSKSNRKLKEELEQLRDTLQRVTQTKPTEVATVKAIPDGSTEARSLVVGEVKAVNPEYGYVALDLSTKTRVKSKIGVKEYEIDPRLGSGQEFVICRGALDGAEPPVFIARIKISDIDENCAIANIPAADAKAIKVGDKVIYISLIDKTKKPTK